MVDLDLKDALKLQRRESSKGNRMKILVAKAPLYLHKPYYLMPEYTATRASFWDKILKGVKNVS